MTRVAALGGTSHAEKTADGNSAVPTAAGPSDGALVNAKQPVSPHWTPTDGYAPAESQERAEGGDRDQAAEPGRDETLASPVTTEGGAKADPIVQTEPQSASFQSWVFHNPNADVSVQERVEALDAVTPEGNPDDVVAVRPLVMERILAVKYMGGETDRSLLTAGVAFGRFCLHYSPDGTFVPSRDFIEDMYWAFVNQEKSDVAPRTQATYFSQLRRLADNRPVTNKVPRATAQAPYSSRQVKTMWNAAFASERSSLREMRTLIALTVGAGARSPELLQMRAAQVDRTSRRVVVSLVHEQWVRDVPVYGEMGTWLAKRARELDGDDLLFRPEVAGRRNAVSNLVDVLSRSHAEFTDFKAVRARHTWLCHYLLAGVPFNVFCEAAGTRNSKAILDMVPFLPSVRPGDVIQAFDRTLTARDVA